MRYLALLRGINVGGNSTVSMTRLQQTFQQAGFTHVTTYINSGNVLFESEEITTAELTKNIELLLEKTFFKIPTVVLSEKDVASVIANVPKLWQEDNLRKYIAFLKIPAKPEDVVKEASLKEGIDFIHIGPDVIYISTKMEGLTKSNFPKLSTKPIYKLMTMRNYNTVQKLFSLMQGTKNPPF